MNIRVGGWVGEAEADFRRCGRVYLEKRKAPLLEGGSCVSIRIGGKCVMKRWETNPLASYPASNSSKLSSRKGFLTNLVPRKFVSWMFSCAHALLESKQQYMYP